MEFIKTNIKYISITALIVIILFASITIPFSNKSQIEDNAQQDIVIIPYTDYDFSKLKKENNHYEYEDDNYQSMFGIDVSAHQDIINWKKAKEDGVEFVYIRLGYRGASEGVLHTDVEFENNYKRAIENDIKVGIYWYSQPIDTYEVKQEVRYVLDVLDGRPLDLPIVYDLEETEFYDGTISRLHDTTKQERTAMAETFCSEMTNLGYDCMIYTNLYWSDNYYDWSKLSNYPIWFAQYGVDYPNYDRPFVMWQYTDDGVIDGIDNPVDLDILFIRKNDQN